MADLLQAGSFRYVLVDFVLLCEKVYLGKVRRKHDNWMDRPLE